MLGLILDTLVLMVLIQLITSEDNDGWAMPAVIAVLASGAMIAAGFAASSASPEMVLFILLGILAFVGLCVALGCFLLMGIQFSKSLMIGGGYVLYKVIFIVLTMVAFGGAS